MIRLESYNKEKLHHFVDSGEFQLFDFLPITAHRALSQIQNPRASEKDILLTLAFENNQLAGYLGTLPDEIFVKNEKIKFAWLSTIYVSENYRGKRIAQQLLDSVFEKYEHKIGITEFTKEAENLYIKTKKFGYINPKLGKRFYFRADLATFLPEKKSFFRYVKPLLQFTDFTANFLKSVFLPSDKKLNFNYKIEKNIDQESENFINSFSPNSSYRTAPEMNWFLQNPWVLENEKCAKNYLFSSYSKEFQYFIVKIFKEKELSTLAILQLRNGHLKIPYLFLKNEVKDFTDFLRNFVFEKKVKMLTSYQTTLNDEILSKKSISYLYQKDFERRYCMSTELLKILPQNYEFEFQDGDGDCVFT